MALHRRFDRFKPCGQGALQPWEVVDNLATIVDSIG
jgi:hypothetical protein